MALDPRELGMYPPVADWKADQWDLIVKILCAETPYVVLEAPTGTGKSVIALALARLLGGRTRILTGQKSLQDQYSSMLALPTVRGRANFPCITESGVTADAAVCSVGGPCEYKQYQTWVTDKKTGRHEMVKKGKPGCPYYDQKQDGLAAPEAVLNYAYWLAQVNYAGAFGKPDLLICDEAHLLEEELRRFSTLQFRRSQMNLLGIKYPRIKETLGSWQRWAAKFIDERSGEYARAKGQSSTYLNRTERRRVSAIKTLYEAAEMLLSPDLPDDGWTVKETPYGLEARPVWITPITPKIFLRHLGKKTVFMSATILSGELFAHQLGIHPQDITFIRADCPFPRASRPLYYRPVGKVSKDTDLDALVAAVDAILETHPTERGLVHTVSYRVARIILARTRYPERLLSHDTSGAKNAALETFKRTPGAVLVSPSVTTGVDLPYDLLRFQVVAKLQFPDLGDPQIKLRMKLGPDGEPDPLAKRWYSWATACALVQAYGRGVRAEDDACVTYLLDGNWHWFRHTVRDLLPRWFTEAFVKAPAHDAVDISQVFPEKRTLVRLAP